MRLEIKNENELWVDGKLIYHADRKIYRAEIFDKARIILKIKAGINNLFCINILGNVDWIAESVTPKEYSPYAAFDIKDGCIFGGVDLPGYGRTVKLDPNTGKILEQTIDK